jgi:biotin carboxyl carrier protein
MRFKVLLNNEEKEIDVTRQGDRLRVSYDDLSFEARFIHTDEAHFVLEVIEPGPEDFICRKRIRAAGYKNGDERQLWANGRLVSYQLVPEGAQREIDGTTTSLSASIPAVVSEILVEVGNKVTAGENLILLESMKMILPIKAPYDGVIESINCSPGEAVQPGVQLLNIEQIVD